MRRPPLRYSTQGETTYLVRSSELIDRPRQASAEAIADQILADDDNVAALCEAYGHNPNDRDALRRWLTGCLVSGDLKLFPIDATPRLMSQPPAVDLKDLIERPPLEPAEPEPPPEHATPADPYVLRLRLLARDPLDNERYTLTVGPNIYEGQTDGDGMLEEELLPGWTAAQLWLPERREAYQLDLRPLPAADQWSGAALRLSNLGLFRTPTTTQESPELRRALTMFQRESGLAAHGDLDAATAAALTEAHGS